MNINEKLNIVIPLYDEATNVYAYVHTAPVSREVFDANYKLLAKTFSTILDMRLGMAAGPRVAANVMREVAEELASPRRSADAMVASFTNEVRRLSNAIVSQPTGWEQVPLQVAIDRGMISQDDAREVESPILFFSVHWPMLDKMMRTPYLEGSAQVCGGQLSSLSPMGYIEFLRTPSMPENTGESPPAA